jgi:hypothetical protein
MLIAASRITQSDPIRLLKGWGHEVCDGIPCGNRPNPDCVGGEFCISNDRGGRIGTYVHKYQHLASSGESVIIDGLCASACTIVLDEFPRSRICVASRATLGFHAAWNYGPNGRAFTDPEATLMLYSTYPAPVRRWIARRGGLTPHIMFLSGKPLLAMYRSCRRGT